MKKLKGFTLVELLVVISLIGVLATLIFANLNAARERARDAVRKSDLRNIQTALRLYYNDNAGYPSNSGYNIIGCGSGASPVSCVYGEAWTRDVTYMNILPDDPLSSQGYSYLGVAGNESYTLSACLENKSDEKGESTTNLTWCPSGWKYVVKP
ncbi:MAG: type II secretion system protein [Candidatus Woesebacteria bacterium]|nr:type II secretion system protein [Candidatus Woesebacteria bacterium]